MTWRAPKLRPNSRSESARAAAQWCAFGVTRSTAHARIERDYAAAIAQGHTVTLLLHNLWGGFAPGGDPAVAPIGVAHARPASAGPRHLADPPRAQKTHSQ